jgi:glucosamine 6-phosphate synthetase-like amidotransferase/phosphosugar isomerase protein
MTAEPAFDPTAPLAGPPDPWESTSTPSRRSGPPYHMTDMIAAEPALAGRIVERLGVPGGASAELAEAIRATLQAGEPVVVTGCGTSEHAALAAAEILREVAHAAGFPDAAVMSEQAFELSLAPPARGLVIGITHEGGTPATNAAIRAARDAGRPTAVVTVTRRSPAGALAGIVVETEELDHGWCHTVGYLSPVVAAACVGAHLSGRPLDPGTIQDLLAAGSRDQRGAERIAATLADASNLLAIASGADRPAGRELVLKVEEASWLPSAYRDLETFLHGHLPATDRSTGLVLILTDREQRTERVARARQALAAGRVLGLRAAAIVTEEVDAALDSALTPAGRLVVPEATDLPAPVAALIGSATPLQLLTERIARARGTNPDPIRRGDPVYVAASEAADG